MSCNEESGFYHKLFMITEKLSADKTPAATHKALKELYQVIQKCDTKDDNAFSLPEATQHTLFCLIQNLVNIISSSDFPADSLLLGSTCLSVLVAELFYPKFASTFLISLYSLVGDIVKGNTQNSKRNNQKSSKKVQYEKASSKTEECEESQNCELNLEFKIQQVQKLASDCILEETDLIYSIEKFTQEETEPKKRETPSFHQIAFLHGILSCQKPDLFSFRSKYFHHKPFLLTLFNSIHLSCLTPCSSQYHAFSILVNWLKTCKTLLNELVRIEDSNAYFSSKTELISKTLSVLESNWESPIKGVNSFVKEAYKVLIALSGAECDSLKNHDFSLIQFLIDQAMKLSWKIKGKYLVLSIVLQLIDYKKFLENYPEIPNEVIFNLKANYASSIISEVYKSIISSMKKCEYSLNELHAEWCKWWKLPIINSLLSDDKLLIQGVSNLVLPWTLKTIPKSYDLLLDIFEEEIHNNPAPTLILLRIAKQCGICEFQEKNHYQEEVETTMEFIVERQISIQLHSLIISFSVADSICQNGDSFSSSVEKHKCKITFDARHLLKSKTFMYNNQPQQ
ncbi:uncharacterized protein C1494.07 [Trichonephila clavata]|uniref:Uncharacterized protein C1494.07 n=1 Tax=Trichonephila clavata TaxID=2740835 RepID=A0A8X6GAN9_TRICU|nr:uncharacterized protein C1494.07 [Trichonephila clavata]